MQTDESVPNAKTSLKAQGHICYNLQCADKNQLRVDITDGKANFYLFVCLFVIESSQL
jgi:hypothetical protein